MQTNWDIDAVDHADIGFRRTDGIKHIESAGQAVASTLEGLQNIQRMPNTFNRDTILTATLSPIDGVYKEWVWSTQGQDEERESQITTIFI